MVVVARHENNFILSANFEMSVHIFLRRFPLEPRIVLLHRPAILVHHRLLQTYFSAARAQPQIALLINAQIPRSPHVQANLVRVRARRHHEVVLQLLLVAVVHQVHARVDSLDFHFPVGRNIRAPFRRIVSDEVVHLARQFIVARNVGCAVRSPQFHPQGSCLGRRLRSVVGKKRAQKIRSRFRAQEQRDFIRREQHRVPRPMRDKFRLRRRLPLIRLKAQRQSSVIIRERNRQSSLR